MPVLSGAGVIFYQSTSELTQKDVHWAMIFLAIIALALVAQAIGVLISAAFGAKLLQKVNAIATIVETKTGPIMDRTASILKDLEPKVKSVGDSAEQITSTVRAHAGASGARGWDCDGRAADNRRDFEYGAARDQEAVATDGRGDCRGSGCGGYVGVAVAVWE